MRKYLLCLGLALCLVLVLVTVESRAADDDLPKDLDKVSKDATTKKWDDVVKSTKDIADKNDAEQVMHLMAKRNPANNKGGIGVGAKAGTIDPDGIEAKVINMIRQGVPDNEKENASDFKKMADQIAAIAGITMNQKPPTKKEDPGGAIWKKSSKDMFEKAQDFAKAIDSKDQKKIKEAAKALDGTCKECHGPYRP